MLSGETSLAADAIVERLRRREPIVPLSGKNVLVISTVEHPEDVLRATLREADEIKVVVPVVQAGVLDWLAGDEQAFGQAKRVAKLAAEELTGDSAAGVVGAADLGLAVRDALATFPADEIVLVVRPDEEERLLESIATESAPRRSFEGVPVRYVTIPDEQRGGDDGGL